MNTKNSPEEKLRAEAAQISKLMKAALAGPLPGQSVAQYMLVKAKPVFSTGIAMDDKFIRIEMPWDKIRESTEAEIAEYVFGLMAETIKAHH